MSTLGTRGKSAESLTAADLGDYCRYSTFTYYRMPDARAGSLKVTLADFIVMHKGQFTLLEVKEVETHEFRLKHANFDAGKVARMRVWQMGGAACWVLLAFPGGWRVSPLDRFIDRTVGGSWDLSDLPLLKLHEATRVMFGPRFGEQQPVWKTP